MCEPLFSLVLSIIRDDDGIVWHDLSEDSKYVEAQVEQDPLDVVATVVSNVGTDHLRAESDHTEDDSDSAAGDECVDGAACLGEGSTVGVEDGGHGEDVEDLARAEESDDEAVDVHVVVDVEEADHRAEDAGEGGVDEHGGKGALGGETLEALVLGAHVGLLVGGVGGEHDGVELVQGGLAHDMGDVRDVGVVALEGTVVASHVTTGYEDTTHQERHYLCNCCEIKGEPVVSALNDL